MATLVTIDEAKAHLNILEDDDDALISGQLKAAESHVERLLGYRFASVEWDAETLPDDIRQARRTNAEELNLVSVQESAQKVDPRVVEAMLTETKPKLALDSKTLIMLDNVGIDGGVIDLLVALAYPEQFVVERRSAGGNNGGGSRWYSGGYRSPYYYDPIWYNDLYPYYYTPLGYGSWGRAYSPYFYGGALSPFIVLRDNSFMQAGRTAAIVSPNRGYTRIVPRAGGVSGGGTRSGSGGGGTVSAPRPRSGGSSGGTPRVTNGGYSRGGGGGRLTL